ncbi:MAG: peptide-methionine (R)-S-oxide reductase MsrB [Polyangia bacterium]
MTLTRALWLIAALSVVPGCAVHPSDAGEPQRSNRPASSYPKAKPVTGKPGEYPVTKTDAEWKRQLTSAQYYILRESGTERPGSSRLESEHGAGDFYCAADHNLLFHSTEKFESGTGWPSFFAPATDDSVKVTADNSSGMSRDEIVCARCGGHLGHVFDDGPRPTGKRYCMDGDAMTFEKAKK